MATTIKTSSPPISTAELQAIEKRLGIALPEDYRAFLLTHNGGVPNPGWFKHGDDEGDVAPITQFHSAAEMETETLALRDYVSRHFVSIGAVSDEMVLMISVALHKAGSVFWNPSNDDIEAANFVRIADSFDKLLAQLDYVEGSKPWMPLIDANDVAGLTQWIDAGGDAQAEDELVTGISAVEHAACEGRVEIVALLMQRGAKARAAATYAEQAGQHEVVKLLRSGGWRAQSGHGRPPN
jgi:cell wall assembly regulator SMI1